MFSPKIHDFSEIFFEKAKIPFFWLRNPVGWFSHVVLALNQWIRLKNGGGKSVPEICKNVATWSLKVNYIQCVLI